MPPAHFEHLPRSLPDHRGPEGRVSLRPRFHVLQRDSLRSLRTSGMDLTWSLVAQRQNYELARTVERQTRKLLDSIYRFRIYLFSLYL